MTIAGTDGFPDGLPPLRRLGRRWFRARVWALLTAEYALEPEAEDGLAGRFLGEPDIAAAVLEWFTERTDLYLVWTPTVELAERGPAGTFAIRESTVLRDFPKALQSLRNSIAVPLGPLDIDAALAELESDGGEPAREPSATKLLSKVAARRLTQAHDRLRRRRKS